MFEMNLTGSVAPAVVGKQVQFVEVGTFEWVVPAGVTRISAVAIGGGGGGFNRVSPNASGHGSSGSGGCLRWSSSISVTPGEKLTIIVGAAGVSSGTAIATNGGFSAIMRGTYNLLKANGGTGGGFTNSATVTNTNKGGIGEGGGDGGNPSYYNYASTGGGGAGGYTGNGGHSQALAAATPGAGGGGGGVTYTLNNVVGPRGGGVGLLGQGPNGAASTSPTHGGDGSQYEGSGTYGGGAGGYGWGGTIGSEPAQGGAVRIVWGSGRNYPNYVPNVA